MLCEKQTYFNGGTIPAPAIIKGTAQTKNATGLCLVKQIATLTNKFDDRG
jgi:hypothetical protein